MIKLCAIIFIILGHFTTHAIANTQSKDRFLGHWVCVDKKKNFEHILTRTVDGYELVAKSDRSTTELKLNGQTITNYNRGIKAESTASLSYLNNKLLLKATVRELRVDLHDKDNKTEIEAKYTFIDEDMIQIDYATRFVYVRNGVMNFISKKGTGFCLQK